LFRAFRTGAPLALSADGRFVATGQGENLLVHDAATGALLSFPRKLIGPVTGLAFRRDGRFLAVASQGPGSSGGFLELFATTGRPASGPFRAHAGAVRGMAFSPDGQVLATVGDDRTVKLWDVGPEGPLTARPRATYLGHSAAVTCVAFSPDGQSVASAG